ncbi:MAG: hypothetical protein HZB73_02155 [Nitrosarchaeum sp.]|nr:hypothetical protein [Nitrosarchaeum sp.]
MLAAYVLDSSKISYTLADVAWDYLKVTLRAKGIDKIQEVVLVSKLAGVLREKIKESDLEKLYIIDKMAILFYEN